MALVQQLLTTASTSCRSITLQNKTLHNYQANCFQCSTVATIGSFEKLSRKARMCCRRQPRNLRVLSLQKIHPLRCYTNEPRSSSFGIHLLSEGFANTPMPIFSFRPFGVIGSRPYNTNGKMHFSRDARAIADKGTVGAKIVSDGNKPFFKNFKYHSERSKELSVHRRNAMSDKGPEKVTPNSKVSASKNIDLVISNDTPIKVDEKDVNLDISGPSNNGKPTSMGKEKAKKQSSKKNKNVASDAVDQPTVSRTPHAKKSSPAKDEQSPAVSEVCNFSISGIAIFDVFCCIITCTNLAVFQIISPVHSSTVGTAGNVSMKVDLAHGKRSSPRKRKSTKKSSSFDELNEASVLPSDSKLVPDKSSDVSSKSKPPGQKNWPKLYPPTAKTVLVVESVTKAKVIQGYLGDMFEVLPSYGHVRDLAARSGSVRPDDDFSMVWEVPSAAWTHLKSIKVALNGAQNLVLASDPDREGEAISWHIIEMLQQQDALRDDINVARVVFNEITESSIKASLQSPRGIDANLVHAYLARRALDYLIGFNISPLLWRKLPGCQSAGRVQSAALSLICDREMEIDGFKPQEYWTVLVEFKSGNLDLANNLLSSHLTHFDSKKLSQFSVSSHTEAAEIEQKINASNFEVLSSKITKKQRNPAPPYITSTLQQDAANKLDFSSTHTMKLAQKLYEGIQLSDGKATGLITYIRTDGLHISDEATKDIQSYISERYGQNFASKNARKYFKKVKNAQEAHEAIRPTDIRRLPSKLVGVLDDDALKLYKLIWSRTMACQMEPTTTEQIQVDIGKPDQSIIFRSTSSKVQFPGYQAVYEDVETNSTRDNENGRDDRSEVFEALRNLTAGDPMYLGKVKLEQHHTHPPPRYSEGSLVKKLEELGIGRPSTYAATIKVLKDRNYVTAKGRTLYPEFRGRMVSAFLSHYFAEVTDYSFTADMETELDNVSAGLTEWKGLLRDYWTRFSKYCEHTGNVHIHQVEKMLEKTFGDFLFASLPDESRTCPSCLQGTLIFKVSRFGAGYFIGCDQHPKCKYIAKTLYGEEDEDITSEDTKRSVEPPKLLGVNPSSNEKVLLKNGPYGYYVQLGEDKKGHVPKRASLSQVKDVSSVTLEDALDLLRYPITLGNHPDDGQPVVLKLAKFGFTIRHRRTIAPVPKKLKPNDITMEKALKLLVSKDVKRCGRPKRQPQVEEAVEAA
ncbi:DNA topoisomerase 1 isoform X1 [Capsicum annuum]